MKKNAAALFSRRSADMQSLVYGTSALDISRGKHSKQVGSPLVHAQLKCLTIPWLVGIDHAAHFAAVLTGLLFITLACLKHV